MGTEAASILAEMTGALLPAFSMFNVGNLVGVLAATAGGCGVLAFLWWGLRKAVNSLMSAFRKGKVSL